LAQEASALVAKLPAEEPPPVSPVEELELPPPQPATTSTLIAPSTPTRAMDLTFTLNLSVLLLHT
jgi:hypothetical protein